jgi:hypothetical protein
MYILISLKLHAAHQYRSLAAVVHGRPAALPAPWRSVTVALPAILVLLGIVMIQNPVEREVGSVAAESREPAAVSAGAFDAGTDEARLVRDPRFTLAVPAAWADMPPPAGAVFAARSGDGTAVVSVRVTRAPDLSFAEFADGARAAFARDLDGTEVVLTPARARGETKIARVSVAPAPGEPSHQSLLAGRDALRYQLTTSIDASATGATRRQARLLAGSFTPEAVR